MGKDMLNKLKEVFDSCKERGQEHVDEVETQELISSIAEDPYFERHLETDVRESVDNARESLEALLQRILKTYKEPSIHWHTFLGFFTKRGRLRDSEKLNLQLNKKRNGSGSDFGLDDPEEDNKLLDESFETKKYRLTKDLKQKLVRKQNLVPKTGKGKFNVTVPIPFEFMNQEKGFSIRQRKVERMVMEKIKEEERALSFEYKARAIPAGVRQKDKLKQITENSEKRKQDNKTFAHLKIQATQKPFAFYERDLEAQRAKKEQAELPQNISDVTPFRATKIPWQVRVDLYQSLLDKNDEREKRVKRNAEVSLSLSKLPPRMEAYEHVRQKKKAELEKRAAERPSFQPSPAREVPDFKRLHKEFNKKLERNKSAAKLTVPTPFHFHEPKNQADLRKHMDAENQIINPTKKKRARSAKLNLDLAEPPAYNPPTTKKHEALVALRRQTQTEKLQQQAEK